ncbi:MAG: hypothetical protein ACI84K_000201 [Pseudohongiellaceae bacterium]|jgi:hypothetical protein
MIIRQNKLNNQKLKMAQACLTGYLFKALFFEPQRMIIMNSGIIAFDLKGSVLLFSLHY